MTQIPTDPFEPGGIAHFVERLRKGDVTSEEVTQAYLRRIEALDPKLQAFEYVAKEQALLAAQAMDALLASGTDLGPLMGVPIAVKDIFAVEGMPTTAGSNTDVTDIIGTEGSFIRNLKRCGCVILGKATCVEFALGGLGINLRRTPWNPWDADTHRIPGGSSSGSGVAVAAGLCAFAIGTDTGGSIRLPAGFCGTFGLKTSPDLWPADGVFPLIPTMDTIGPLTRSATDAAVVFGTLTGQSTPTAAPLNSLRLGKPDAYFYNNLDTNYEKCMTAALKDLEKAGVDIVPIEVPEAKEREVYFPIALPAYALGILGRERFQRERDRMDPIVAARCASGLDVKADELIRIERRRFELWKIAKERLNGLDGWVTPTMALVAPPVTGFDDLEKGIQLSLGITQDTQPANLFNLCGISMPIQMYGSELPVGLQVLCRNDHIAQALSIGLAIEQVTGVPPMADVTGFVG
jgi:aspartyl-tRNA(Asn)/glutamyl-tRNA(Gln) amidotransferase subunit A